MNPITIIWVAVIFVGSGAAAAVRQPGTVRRITGASEAATATCGVVEGEGSGNQTTTKARATSLLLLQLSSLTRSSAVSEARLGAGISPPAKLAADFAGNLIAQMAA